MLLLYLTFLCYILKYRKARKMNAIKTFRSRIRFSERFSENIKPKLIGMLDFIEKKTKSLERWRIRNGYHQYIEYFFGVMIILFSVFVILPRIAFLAILKSI